MQTRSVSLMNRFNFEGEYYLQNQPNDMNEKNCNSPILQFNILHREQGSSTEFRFCIQDFNLAPNHQYLALNIQRLKITTDKICESSHFDSRVQIIEMKTNQSLFQGRFWCFDRLNMKFSADSQFLLCSRADQISIIDIKQKKEKVLKVNASFYSLGLNNQVNFIIYQQYLIYSIKNDNFKENTIISKLFNNQKVLGFWKISSNYLLADTQTKSYLIYKKNKKIISQQKTANQYKKNIYIFQRRIIVIPQKIKKVCCIKQLRTGKIIRRINDFQLFQGNVFQTNHSIYLFAYLFKENAQEKYKFYLFDLLKGVKKELNQQFDQKYQIKYFPLIMQKDLIIGIDEKGTLIRYFSFQI